MSRIRVALCQLDTVVGDIARNSRLAMDAIARADDEGADLVALPELTVTGYPPEDLLLKPAFVEDNLSAVSEIAKQAQDVVALVGFVDAVGGTSTKDAATSQSGALRQSSFGTHSRLRNALGVCFKGEVVATYHKRLLPNYGVFDEQRWFAPGDEELQLFEVAGVAVGVSICEDLWARGGPLAELGAMGAQLVVNINASPYSVGRLSERLEVIRERLRETHCPIAYVNQVGGQDELVFDGGSLVVSATGEVLAEAPQFREDVLVTDVEIPENHKPDSVFLTGAPRSRTGSKPSKAKRPAPLSQEQEVYCALVLGTRDYLGKNGFSDAVVGLSGGIDSSLVAAVAVDALGAGHVHGVAMPSRYSSESSLADARSLADNLGIDLIVAPIEEAHSAFRETLYPFLGDKLSGLPDENLQSRVRGVLLMAISNSRGWIVLTTGNKSELATGYSTLYGDSAGGFAVIKDVPKTLVYRLCRYRNDVAGRELIPENVLTKPPSAELRPGQRDTDSLPPYEVLDPILNQLVDLDRSIEEVVAAGHDLQVVTRVARLIDSAEYKRRQSPPGVRISTKSFGKDRRVPITNRYRDRARDGEKDPVDA